MKTKDEILAELPNFYGTENYHQWSALFRNFVLTDGAKYIAEECGAYWLMDAVASHLSSYKDEGFVVAKFQAIVGGWELGITDGNEHSLVTQRIEFTDFPLDEITLYVVKQDDLWVVLLPSEY